MRSKWIALLSSILVIPSWVSNAWGWGSYGHQQANVAAIDVISDTPLGKWLQENRKTVQRLAITPDRDWKHQGPFVHANEHEKEKELLEKIDQVEHSLHYLEIDALLEFKEILTNPNAIDKLPAGPFKKVAQGLLDLLKQRAKYLNGIETDPKKQIKDPDNPTIIELARHGVAAWRILQLHDLAANALKNGDFKKALFYLGTLGHYTADLAQPYHGTINYDGQLSDADGIHSAFESLTFDVTANDMHIIVDKETHLWPSFIPTQDRVNQTAKEVYAKLNTQPLTETTVVRKAYQTVIDGYPFIEPLAKIFSRMKPEHIPLNDNAKFDQLGGAKHLIAHEATCGAAMKGAKHQSGYVPRQNIRDFRDSKIRTNGIDPSPTVFDFAKDRLGVAAAFTAQVWQSAYLTAGQPALQGKFDFNYPQEVRENYPFPDFIP